jgi:hypothetical protein
MAVQIAHAQSSPCSDGDWRIIIHEKPGIDRDYLR